MVMSEASAAWIEDKFLDWQKQKGRASLAKFAAWLGTSPNSLNNWISRKQTPSGDSLRLLGDKLGWEIYDVVGEPRPHPVLQMTSKLWGRLTDDEIKRIEKILRGAEKRSAEAPADDAPKSKRAGSSS